MNHLVNSIPGGIASYRMEKERFISIYFSDGVAELSGHTRSEMEEMVRGMPSILFMKVTGSVWLKK